MPDWFINFSQGVATFLFIDLKIIGADYSLVRIRYVFSLWSVLVMFLVSTANVFLDAGGVVQA